MRTDNGKVKGYIISIYYILIFLVVIMATVFNAFSGLTDNLELILLMLLFIFVTLFLIIYLIAKYFEYDSYGDNVEVTNRGFLLSTIYDYRSHEIRFNKKELIKFKTSNYFIYRSLVLYTKSKGRSVSKTRFNITFVKTKKRKYIKQSLGRIMKNNISN